MTTVRGLLGALVAFAVGIACSALACGGTPSPCDKLTACSGDVPVAQTEIDACKEDYKQGAECAAARDCQLGRVKCGTDNRTDPASRLQSIGDCSPLLVKAIAAKCKGYPVEPAK